MTQTPRPLLSRRIRSCFSHWRERRLYERSDVIDESRRHDDRLLGPLTRQDDAGFRFVINDDLEHVGLTKESGKLPADGGIILGEPAEFTAHAAMGFPPPVSQVAAVLADLVHQGGTLAIGPGAERQRVNDGPDRLLLDIRFYLSDSLRVLE